MSGVQGGAFPNFTICQPGLMWLMSYRLATHTHLAPFRTNLIELGARFKLDRMRVHVRDPRQALISWFHFFPSVIGTLDPSQKLHYDVPDDYLEWPQARQLDWQISHFLPWFIDWIVGWLDAPEQPWSGTKILYTTFEEMVADTRGFFDRILAFYDIDRAGFIYPDKRRVHGDRNFRRGDVDEWRTTLSPEQMERASSAIPERLFDRFGWPRR
ncbi:sulfotransferase domain-containing protein [Bradyrhizobium liaoningense]|uniref:sulfotransferase domain-containing protein n=1 Tax=Bradyrhizobium liaoningense TaxID=43992 RepID=UPI001BABA025|nr:sulfotransferase domain-containing protein [Bradyrhizobium liaoningense]MBR0718871.1 sulfotransferase domain-containing protein [Bradyrhizobium liaoningense]